MKTMRTCLAAPAVAAALLAVPTVRCAAETTGPATPPPLTAPAEVSTGVAAAAAAQPSPTPQPSPAPAAPLKRRVVLMGERPVLERASGKQASTVDIAAEVKAVLGVDAEDKTTTGELVADTLSKADEVVRLRPDLVIVFNGHADGAKGTSDDDHMQALNLLGQKLMQGGATVYFVPSSPALRAATAANLRISASMTNVTFVETGTEYAGQPYAEALQAVRRAEELHAMAGKPEPTTAPVQVLAPGQVTPPPTGGTVQMDPSQATVVKMRPPAPLKRFDPKQAGKPVRSKKRPDTAP